MPGRGGGKRVAKAKETSAVSPKKRKVVPKVDNKTEEEVRKPPVGRKKATTRNTTKKDDSTPAESLYGSSSNAPPAKTLGVKRGGKKKVTPTDSELNESLVTGRADAAVAHMPTGTQRERILKEKIRGILKRGELKELAILRGEDVSFSQEEEDAEVEAAQILDSDDEIDEREHNKEKHDMDGKTDYTPLPESATAAFHQAEDEIHGRTQGPLNLSTGKNIK